MRLSVEIRQCASRLVRCYTVGRETLKACIILCRLRATQLGSTLVAGGVTCRYPDAEESLGTSR